MSNLKRGTQPDITDSDRKKRQKLGVNDEIDVEAGLSVQLGNNNNDFPSENKSEEEKEERVSTVKIDGKQVPLEIIESSSENDQSDEDNRVEEQNNIPSTNNTKNDKTVDDNYELSDDSSDNSDTDSDMSEFMFETLDSPDGETILDLYDPNFTLPPLDSIKITKKLCFQIRKFLKTEGHSKLLDIFLPLNPTSSLIFTLVKLLGYSPPKIKRLNQLSERSLLETSIVCLKTAINKVLRTRTRLSNFHTISDVTNALKKAQNVLVLTGAGISTSLGIPDFRSSKGFYSKMKNLGLDDPQEVFSLELFKRDPSIFYSIAYMILPPEHSFTPLHGFIKLLQDKGKLLRNYTQNIDNLEGNVGIIPENLVQCHGSFATASCVTCKYKIPGETLYPNLRSKKIAYCPFCDSERRALLKKYDKHEDEGIGNYLSKFQYIESFGVMKPDITFFGENLPERYHSTIKEDIKKCDLLICIGTSLKVAPVSEIVNRVPEDVPQILINRDPINHCEFDVEFLGYCDQAITYICGEQLKWEIPHKDFQKILNSGLVLDIIDEECGCYRISDANERLQLSLKKSDDSKPENGGEKTN